MGMFDEGKAGTSQAYEESPQMSLGAGARIQAAPEQAPLTVRIGRLEAQMSTLQMGLEKFLHEQNARISRLENAVIG